MHVQDVGKIRLKLSTHLNHWWEVPLYLTSRGMTTSPIPFGGREFDITFDFIDHVLIVQTSDGRNERMPLQPQSVAEFYGELMSALHRLGIDVKIWTTPSEVPDAIPFEKDTQHAAYDAAYAHRACWGGFDLAVTRFSGRRAPERPDADSITREGYSHEVSSCGLWFGSGSLTGPAFYSYAAPEPPGFREVRIRPAAAFYSTEFSNFLLLYDEVRQAANPRERLLEFLQSTYEAAAILGRWDRENLERKS